ncbi:hypothetical protein HPB52_014444 [Rhipicephalus sanguineus]|uniref:Thioredoxin domain-containing protein n=1 Tax=Rhipicephalus sanguineus TaxID=34632 RepID=A0A9D4PE03_RHISA|nr:hypothetical protein HPB52_014444 [Rhipicephalus sanguineus]
MQVHTEFRRPGESLTVTDIFKGHTLLRAHSNDSEQSAEEALGDAKAVALYFAAYWCPPCFEFTIVLAHEYDEMKEESAKPVEIVFVTADRTEEDMLRFMAHVHGPWYAVKFDDKEFRNALFDKYRVSGLPDLVVIKRDGTVITADGVADIKYDGSKAFAKWAAAA